MWDASDLVSMLLDCGTQLPLVGGVIKDCIQAYSIVDHGDSPLAGPLDCHQIFMHFIGTADVWEPQESAAVAAMSAAHTLLAQGEFSLPSSSFLRQ